MQAPQVVLPLSKPSNIIEQRQAQDERQELPAKVRQGHHHLRQISIQRNGAIALYGDLPQMVMALAHFRWEFLPLILGLTLFNYVGRFGKWQYYLRRLHIRLSWQKSLMIFISGLSMAITPGKVGEL